MYAPPTHPTAWWKDPLREVLLPGVVVNAWKSSTQEAKAGLSQVQGLPGINGEFKASLNYILRFSQQQQQQQQKYIKSPFKPVRWILKKALWDKETATLIPKQEWSIWEAEAGRLGI